MEQSDMVTYACIVEVCERHDAPPCAERAILAWATDGTEPPGVLWSTERGQHLMREVVPAVIAHRLRVMHLRRTGVDVV